MEPFGPDEVDYFRTDSLFDDPYPYFDRLREECPVRREPHHGVVMVTGYEEAAAIFSDPNTFSSCNSLSGRFPVSRSRSRATTSPSSSTGTAISCR